MIKKNICEALDIILLFAGGIFATNGVVGIGAFF